MRLPKYVRMPSAPARFRHTRDSRITRSSQPAVLDGSHVHRVLAAHLVGESRGSEAVLHPADDVEIR